MLSNKQIIVNERCNTRELREWFADYVDELEESLAEVEKKKENERIMKNG